MRFEAVIRGGVSATVAVVCLTLSGYGARAGDWDIKPRVSVEELFTDNVNLDQTDRESDFITILRPGISIERTGAARSNLSLDFSIEHSNYLRDKERKDNRVFLDAEAGAEIYEDVFFVDGLASVDQRIVSNTSAESGTGITDDSNRTQVASVSINPNIRHHFKNWADYRFDYVLSNVRVADDSIDTTVTQRYGSTLTSGRNFPNLRWNIQTLSQKTEYKSSSREDTRRFAQLDVQYASWRYVQPTGSIGYERIKDNTILQQPDGLIWTVGAILQPGPRTRVAFSHGQRYGDPYNTLDASYEISDRTSITASYSQVLETSQGLSLDQLNSPTDGLTDQADGFSLTNNAFRQSDFDVNFVAERGRNTYRAEYSWSKRETDADGSTNTINNYNAIWQRQINPRLSGTVNLGYRSSDFGPTQDNRVDNLFTYSVGVEYRLQEDLRSGLEYNGTRKISDAAGASYTENAVSFTLTAQF